LWIKDIVGQKRLIINANEITPNFLKNVTISEFDKNFDLSKIIISENINISSNDWKLYKSQLIENDIKKEIKEMVIYSNFNYETISNLFSNLSSLSIFELFKLKRNYKQINYSTIEVDAQLQKLYSYPFYFTLMTILSAIIMFNSRSFKSTTLKIILGLFFCVVIYYINNLSQALGTTGKIPLLVSVWITISIITVINFIAFQKINEK
jgi:lipopolysaccharide export system permease protein